MVDESPAAFPAHWRIASIGQLADVRGGKRLPKGVPLTTSRTNHPYLRVVDFGEGRVRRDDLMYVPDDVFPAIRRYTISSRDIYISIVGTVGLVGTVAEDLDGASLTENAAKICNLSPEIDRDFLAYYLSSELGQREIRAQTIGSTQPKLALFRIKNITVPVPSIAEQRSIAATLRRLDDKIELNRRMNRTLESIARAIFKSWFVDFDPVRRKMEGGEVGLPPDLAAMFSQDMWETALGPIPVGWDVERCSSQFSLTMGQSPPGESYNEAGEGQPFYQGRRDFGSRYPTRRVYCDSPTRLAEPGDTLVSVRAPVGDINMATEPCCIGRGVAAVRHYSGATTYTFETMNALGLQFADFQASGTVFGSVSGKDFAGLMVIAPPRPLVAAYEQEVRPIERLIKSQHETCGSVIELRDALLPRLMAGVT